MVKCIDKKKAGFNQTCLFLINTKQARFPYDEL